MQNFRGVPLQPPSKVASRKKKYPMTASESNFLFYNALILSQENICKKTKQIRKLCNFLCNRNFSAKLRKYLKFALLGQYSQTFYMYSLRQPVNKLSTGITVKKSSLLGATEFYMYWEVWLKNEKKLQLFQVEKKSRGIDSS